MPTKATIIILQAFFSKLLIKSPKHTITPSSRSRIVSSLGTFLS